MIQRSPEARRLTTRPVRGIALLITTAVCATSRVHADWIAEDLSKAANAAEQIVVARMVKATLTLEDQTSRGEATLIVEKPIVGTSEPATPLTIQWENSIQISCPRHDLEIEMGRRAIWLLSKDAQGRLHANAGNIIHVDEPNKASVIGAITWLKQRGPVEPGSSQASLLAALEEELKQPSENP
jgi:hypothetical protein